MASRKMEFETPRIRNRKYKMAAKERRRIVRARKTDAGKTPNDLGEELPPFMIPPRYKLIFKFMQAHRNASRIQRKQIPLDVTSKFAQKAKDHAQYVHA